MLSRWFVLLNFSERCFKKEYLFSYSLQDVVKMTKMLKSRIFNTAPFSHFLLYWGLCNASITSQGLSGGCFVTIRPSHLQLPSSERPRCPSTAGSTHVGLRHLISRCLYPVPMYSDLQRCTEMLEQRRGALFITQNTSFRTVLLLPWQTSLSVRLWSWCYCPFFPSDQKDIFHWNPYCKEIYNHG